MKKKKVLWLVLILVIVISTISFLIAVTNKRSDEISDGYIAVFHGGSGEKTYATYIYKNSNGQSNSGFDYTNVTNTTASWGSDKLNTINYNFKEGIPLFLLVGNLIIN